LLPQPLGCAKMSCAQSQQQSWLRWRCWGFPPSHHVSLPLLHTHLPGVPSSPQITPNRLSLLSVTPFLCCWLIPLAHPEVEGKTPVLWHILRANAATWAGTCHQQRHHSQTRCREPRAQSSPAALVTQNAGLAVSVRVSGRCPAKLCPLASFPLFPAHKTRLEDKQ